MHLPNLKSAIKIGNLNDAQCMCKTYSRKVQMGSTKANGREPKSCLGRVFNFKLGCFVMCTIA